MLGDLEDEIGTSDPAVEHYRAALDDAAGLPELELIIQHRLVNTRQTDGIAVARAHARAAVRLAEHLGDDTSRRARSLRWLSFGSTRAIQIRSISPGAQSPWPSAPATSRRSRRQAIYGHFLAWSGRLDEAREILSELLRSAERDDAGIGTPLFYLCIVEERAGRLALAQAHAERKYEHALQDGGAGACGHTFRTHVDRAGGGDRGGRESREGAGRANARPS